MHYGASRVFGLENRLCRENWRSIPDRFPTSIGQVQMLVQTECHHISSEITISAGVVTDRQLILLFLIVERIRGSDSEWGPWINVLPQAFNTPLHYGISELEELHGTTLYTATKYLPSFFQTPVWFIHQILCGRPNTLWTDTSFIDVHIAKFNWIIWDTTSCHPSSLWFHTTYTIKHWALHQKKNEQEVQCTAHKSKPWHLPIYITYKHKSCSQKVQCCEKLADLGTQPLKKMSSCCHVFLQSPRSEFEGSMERSISICWANTSWDRSGGSRHERYFSGLHVGTFNLLVSSYRYAWSFQHRSFLVTASSRHTWFWFGSTQAEKGAYLFWWVVCDRHHFVLTSMFKESEAHWHKASITHCPVSVCFNWPSCLSLTHSGSHANRDLRLETLQTAGDISNTFFGMIVQSNRCASVFRIRFQSPIKLGQDVSVPEISCLTGLEVSHFPLPRRLRVQMNLRMSLVWTALLVKPLFLE